MPSPKELTMTDHEQLEDGASATEPKGISRRKMIFTGPRLPSRALPSVPPSR
jgi:hypothetical protein